MCDEWMPTLRLRLSPQEYEQLPRHAAYRYAYMDGSAVVSPWPRHLHATLDLRELSPQSMDPYKLRRLRAEDEPKLVELFAAAFRKIEPFAALTDETAVPAAQQCLRRTFSGGDGPWIEAASVSAHARYQRTPVGAALVTLLPGGDPAAHDSYRWLEPPPPDLWQRRAGQPHLTWIFVNPVLKGINIGSAMLSAAGRSLREHGYSSLWTTFLVGNDESVLWHWRNGFKIVPPPRS